MSRHEAALVAAIVIALGVALAWRAFIELAATVTR